jgi:Ca2+-binding RTX toxin-like protein
VISSNTVTILAGYTSATINLPILEDLSVENNETLTLSIDSVSAGVLSKSTASITIHDSTTTVQSSGELTSLSNDVVDTISSSITSTLEDAYKSAATNASKTWTLNSDVFTNAANDLVPGLKTIMDVFYGIIQSEIDTAADTQDVTAFATALMVANTATKLFDPSTIIGTNINGDGSYLAGQSLTTLTAAIEAEYTTFKTLTNDTIGDIFGDDTAANFANATVAMLTDGNDAETLSNASEIIATFDGVDIVYGLGGNDKMIGGKDVDTLYGGDGADHLYGFTGNDVLDGGAGDDKIVGGLGDDTISAGAGDDLVMAQTGDDIINTGAGNDEIYGGLGDDTINITGKTGAFTDTINGGAGTDTLNINYSGITSLKDFTISKSGDVTTLTDSSGGVIHYESIENLSVNDFNYTIYTGGYYVDGRWAGLTNVIWSPTEKILYSDGSGSVFYAGGMTGGEDTHLEGLENTDNFEFIGSSNQDTINLNVDRSTYTGDFTINTGGSNDSVLSAKLINTDSINLGAGDDSISVMVSGTYGTPSLSAMNVTLLDGGTGTDTISFEESTVASGTTLSLTTGGATNFENLTGSASNETLNGDANANAINGLGGADTIYGNGGNDSLYGHVGGIVGIEEGASYQSGDDNLYGGAGDDQLYGTAGENILDGGTGKDTTAGGTGADTFVIRSGDGNSNITLADIITDFEDGTDVIGMDDGLQFSDLTIIQGSGSNSNDTLVSITSTGEYLAIVEGISTTALTELDFTPVDIL